MAAGCLATVMPILSRRIGRMWKAYFLLLLALQCASIVIVIAQQRQFVQVPALDMVRQLTISFALTIPILLAIWDRKSDGGWLHWSGISWNSTWYAFLVWRELGS